MTNIHTRSVFRMFIEACGKYKGNTAFIYRVGGQEFSVTFKKLLEDVFILSRSLSDKGISKGDKVLFISDNRYAWIVTDMALASLGAVSIPRGSDTPPHEMKYITGHSEARFAIFETEAVYESAKKELLDEYFKKIFLIEGDIVGHPQGQVHTYNEILADRTFTEDEMRAFCELDPTNESDIFTLIYTSGTTGYPKGVPLSNMNVIHNLLIMPEIVALTEKDSFLSILPTWHIFERAAELIAVTNGCCTVYSGVKTFAQDLEQYKPTIVASVPRVWESLYSKVQSALEKQSKFKLFMFQFLARASASFNRNSRYLLGVLPEFEKTPIKQRIKETLTAIAKVILLLPLKIFAMNKFKAVQAKFGGRLRLAVSGGGSLPGYLEDWLDAIGLRIVNAYGMTECAPAIAGRGLDCQIFGTLGKPVKGTILKIIDENGKELPRGHEGEIVIKGPQVFAGYYNSPEENAKSFTSDGFFRTGDLGKLTFSGELKITGRIKDIIVLANGENIDPSRIESAITMLPFIKDAVLVGQDQKSLAALIIPDMEKLKDYMTSKLEHIRSDFDMNSKPVVDHVKREINKLLSNKKGFKNHEKLHNLSFLEQEFKQGEELTNTLKKRRHFIEKRYKELISGLFKQNNNDGQ
ncbi:AMP-binding protein [Seleniivibrio sp.]|uniref:AMP-dependent synthetase/ligase n=1 Tax=Seleniivibrio sp. TaxID=2898801 RepID=UPI0025E7FD63|nr:AMP-binding protein [Seleniivibrio sp.]MCD8552349.1 AMP-binding protein [Seleniivibrio sp.]